LPKDRLGSLVDKEEKISLRNEEVNCRENCEEKVEEIAEEGGKESLDR